jgi:hypothetical protein
VHPAVGVDRPPRRLPVVPACRIANPSRVVAAPTPSSLASQTPCAAAAGPAQQVVAVGVRRGGERGLDQRPRHAPARRALELVPAREADAVRARTHLRGAAEQHGRPHARRPSMSASPPCQCCGLEELGQRRQLGFPLEQRLRCRWRATAPCRNRHASSIPCPPGGVERSEAPGQAWRPGASRGSGCSVGLQSFAPTSGGAMPARSPATSISTSNCVRVTSSRERPTAS